MGMGAVSQRMQNHECHSPKTHQNTLPIIINFSIIFPLKIINIHYFTSKNIKTKKHNK